MNDRETRLRHRARELHDDRCRTCRLDNNKYVETCQKFQQAIFDAGRELLGGPAPRTDSAEQGPPSYFDVLRSMTDDPDVLRAADRAEVEQETQR